MARLENRDDTMQFRLSAHEKRIIRKAASSKHQPESSYARESVLKQAQMDLADKTDYEIPAKDMKNFLAALDKPAISKTKLKALLADKTILD
ncbi:MAG: DUF1778 domain-containing protein [Alphaproteobacteria bacterium]|nr:DUF1778 domain-containing protein [Alphaproteobacteria bacterium]QQS56811.1 MAG: DUF1778 domain-containing protein [Alphaproteobacteria bacterium]